MLGALSSVAIMLKPSSAILSLGALLFQNLGSVNANADGVQEPLRDAIDPLKYKAACPDYKHYAMRQQ